MHKRDSVDFTNRVKLLLELMKNNSAEESKQSDEEEHSDDSDVSDTEQDDKHEDYDHHYHRTFHLNKSFEDHVKARPSARHTVWDNYQFMEKMYRVIPIRLDQKVNNSINPMKHNKRY